jgi:hypothetical protein
MQERSVGKMMRRLVPISLCLLAMVSGIALMQTPSPTPDEPEATATVLGAINTSTPTAPPPKPEDPRPAVCSAPYQEGWEAHIVTAGDTLPAMMRGAGDFSVTQLAALNCIDDAMALPVGSVVWLPAASVAEATAEVCQQIVKSLDCAAQTQGILGAQQLFQNGMMIWREDTREIWVISNNSTTLQVFEDEYVDGEADPSDTPPNSFFVPKRGFGKLWAQLGGQKSELGWATAPESQISLNVQAAGRESYTSYVQMPDGVIYAATVLPRQSEGWWVKLGGS